MTVPPILSSTAVAAGRPHSAQQAAEQFEAVLINQMLQSVLPEDTDDPAGAPALGIALEHMATVIAHSGGLGIAKLLTPALQIGGDNGSAGSVHPKRAVIQP